jgi:magnesium chelatase family protein
MRTTDLPVSVTLFRGPTADEAALDHIGRRPRSLRAPHHTCSRSSIEGRFYLAQDDAWRFQPGEITLAYGGTLLLTDLPDWRLECLEVIGRALRSGELSFYSEGGQWVTIPAHFQVVATATDCPCGVPSRCACTEGQKRRFEARVRRCLNHLQNAQPCPLG